MISPWVTTTWEGSIRGQGSAIFKISTLWKRFLLPVSSPKEKEFEDHHQTIGENIKLQKLSKGLKKNLSFLYSKRFFERNNNKNIARFARKNEPFPTLYVHKNQISG